MLLDTVRAGLRRTDDLLRSRRQIAPRHDEGWRWWWYFAIVVGFAPIYGAVMGTYRFVAAERLLQVLYSGVKLPILLLVTLALCMPGFFVLNTLLGLRRDFPEACRAILAGQAVMSVALASLAPLTRVWYFSTESHRAALIFNMAMLAVAALAGQATIIRHYGPLIRGNRRHIPMLAGWALTYAFVGIQMGWTFRPFIGSPGLAVTFFRQEPFTNAYVVVFGILTGM
jgi:hypothetical protein